MNSEERPQNATFNRSLSSLVNCSYLVSLATRSKSVGWRMLAFDLMLVSIKGGPYDLPPHSLADVT